MEKPATDVAREDHEYPQGLKLVSISAAICLTIFLISLEYEDPYHPGCPLWNQHINDSGC